MHNIIQLTHARVELELMEQFAMILTLLFAVTTAKATTNLPYRAIGNISVPHPAFIEVFPCGYTTATKSLWITEFQAFRSGNVYAIDNITNYYPSFSTAKYSSVATGFKWPNKISLAPKELGSYVVVPDGFLVPFASTGGLYLISASCSSGRYDGESPVELTTPKNGWFYHMVYWRDMNNDGKLDIITARATKPLIGSAKGQLLWLEQPSQNPIQSVPWTEHVIADGPDVGFTVADLQDNDGQFEVFAAEFFSQKLSLLIINDKDASVNSTRTIDDTIGPAYYVSVEDLNADGSLELLVTNHVAKEGGSVYAYEIPSNIIKGDFKRHVLATDFPVTEGGSNQAAPGFARAFFPHKNYKGKPYITVAGDGSQKGYLLYPTGADFQYNKTVMVSTSGVVGYIAVDDVIGEDGWAEIFVPDYDDSKLYAYTFAP